MRLSVVILLFTLIFTIHARTPQQPIKQSDDLSINQPNVLITAELTSNGSIIIDGRMYQLIDQSISQSNELSTHQSDYEPVKQSTKQSRRRPFLIAIAQTIQQSVSSLISPQSIDQLNDQTRVVPLINDLNAPSDVSIIQSTDQSLNSAPYDEEECEPALISPTSAKFWIYVGACLALLLSGGLISGLTIGLFSLSNLELAVLENDSQTNETDRRRAHRLKPLLKESRHHLLLVTLLLTNTGCMEALPELLDKLVPEWAAVVISVSLVVVFSEILPQAICTRAPLAVGSFFSPLCWALMLIMFPIAWPISKALDWLIPEGDGAQFLASRSQVTSLLEIIKKNHVLSDDEASIMQSILAIKQSKISEVMVDAKEVYMLEMNERLTADKLKEILRIGHSRIPVYRGNNRANIQGMLLTKRLIVARPEDEDPVSKYLQSTSALLDQTMHHHSTHSEHVLKPIWVKPDTDVLTLLDEFQRARCHLAIVADDLSEVALAYHSGKNIERLTEIRGIVTMEDLIEIVLEIDITEHDNVTALVVDSDEDLPMKTRIVDPRSAKPSTLNEMLNNLTILAEQKAVTRKTHSRPIVPPFKRSKTASLTSVSQTTNGTSRRGSINQSRLPMLKQPLLEEETSLSGRSRSGADSQQSSGSLRIDCDEKSLPPSSDRVRCVSETTIFTPAGSMRRGNSKRFLLTNPPINISNGSNHVTSLVSPSLNGVGHQGSWGDSPVLMEEHLPNGQVRVTIAPKHEAEARLDIIEERANQTNSQSSDSSEDENEDLDVVSAFAARVLDSIAAKRKGSSSSSDDDDDDDDVENKSPKVNSPTLKSPTDGHPTKHHDHHDHDDSDDLSTPHRLTGLIGPSLTS